MNLQHHWLSDVIVLNDNTDPRVAGDVSVYRNAADLSHHIEHWYIDEPHLALDGLGRRVVLRLEDKCVVVDRVEEDEEGLALLRDWLASKAQHLLKVRHDRAAKKRFELGSAEAAGVLPDTIEGLVAYVGFERSR